MRIVICTFILALSFSCVEEDNGSCLRECETHTDCDRGYMCEEGVCIPEQCESVCGDVNMCNWYWYPEDPSVCFFQDCDPTNGGGN